MTDPFKTIETLARERNEMLATVTRIQERITRYVEVARCAKVLVGTGVNFGHGATREDWAPFLALEAAVKQLENGPEAASMQTPPAPPQLKKHTVGASGVAGISGVHSGHPDCPMTKGLPSGEWFGNCTCPQPQEKR